MWASPHEKKELERGRTWNCYACVSFRIMFTLCIIQSSHCVRRSSAVVCCGIVIGQFCERTRLISPLATCCILVQFTE